MLSAEEPATDIENGVALLAISVSNTRLSAYSVWSDEHVDAQKVLGEVSVVVVQWNQEVWIVELLVEGVDGSSDVLFGQFCIEDGENIVHLTVIRVLLFEGLWRHVY